MCLALSQHHAALALSCALLCLSITLLLLSHVPCFVSASRCSCFLMCLALSQHHAALALSCALLCLSITLLLLSHVPCLVSASHCSCFLMPCFVFTLHSISHVPSFVSVLLSQVLCFVSASLTPFLLSLMCLICLVTVLVHCFVSTSRRSYVLVRCLRVSRCSCSLCALLCPAQHHTMLSQVLRLSITPLMCLALSQHDITPLMCLALSQHDITPLMCLALSQHDITPLMCLALSQHDITPLFSALPFPLDIFSRLLDRLLHVVTKLSNELEINGSEILYCPMN